MTDAEFEKGKARLIALRDRWQSVIMPGGWTITHCFMGDSNDMIDHKGKSVPKALALCAARWEYMEATIQWNMPRLADHDDESLERTFIHELMHVFLNETREEPFQLRHEERVATELALAFYWLREHLVAQLTESIDGPGA